MAGEFKGLCVTLLGHCFRAGPPRALIPNSFFDGPVRPVDNGGILHPPMLARPVLEPGVRHLAIHAPDAPAFRAAGMGAYSFFPPGFPVFFPSGAILACVARLFVGVGMGVVGFNQRFLRLRTHQQNRCHSSS